MGLREQGRHGCILADDMVGARRRPGLLLWLPGLLASPPRCWEPSTAPRLLPLFAPPRRAWARRCRSSRSPGPCSGRGPRWGWRPPCRLLPPARPPADLLAAQAAGPPCVLLPARRASQQRARWSWSRPPRWSTTGPRRCASGWATSGCRRWCWARALTARRRCRTSSMAASTSCSSPGGRLQGAAGRVRGAGLVPAHGGAACGGAEQRARGRACGAACRCPQLQPCCRASLPTRCSYETVRKHAAELAGCCDLLVCDEGHRLKASGGALGRAGLLRCRRGLCTPPLRVLPRLAAPVANCCAAALQAATRPSMRCSSSTARGACC
jgi:hypothetical protein